MAYFLGIDIGTSGTKTLLVDENGEIHASMIAEYPVDNPKPLHSEQNPADWWNAVKVTVPEVIKTADVSPADIKGIGLSGQMHGLVMLDSAGEVLRPAILWNDGRTYQECEEITVKAGGKEALIGMVANPALTGFTAPKILWVMKNEPQIYEKVHKMLLPKDYVRFRMTGTYATEVSDASGTLLLDVKNRMWHRDLASKLGIDLDLLPGVFESPEVTGKLTREAAEELGLEQGIPVVGGAGDQAASAIGNGIVKQGAISATIGTSGVVFAFSGSVKIDPTGRVHTFCHAVPNSWHVMGVSLSAGGSFRWFRDALGEIEIDQAKKMGVNPYEILCEMAEESAIGAEGLYFLPYLMGERTPHADPLARGAYVGLTARSTKSDIIRATLEGVTFGMRDSLEIIRGMDIPVAEIRVSGGGAVNPFWKRMQAEIYGQSVAELPFHEGGAFGAAILAMVGTGFKRNVEDAAAQIVKTQASIAPDAAAVKTYTRHYEVWKKLYPALKDSFGEIHNVIS